MKANVSLKVANQLHFFEQNVLQVCLPIPIHCSCIPAAKAYENASYGTPFWRQLAWNHPLSCLSKPCFNIGMQVLICEIFIHCWILPELFTYTLHAQMFKIDCVKEWWQEPKDKFSKLPVPCITDETTLLRLHFMIWRFLAQDSWSFGVLFLIGLSVLE